MKENTKLIALSRKLSKEHKYDAAAEYKAVLEEILSLSADLKSESSTRATV